MTLCAADEESVNGTEIAEQFANNMTDGDTSKPTSLAALHPIFQMFDVDVTTTFNTSCIVNTTSVLVSPY